MGLGTWKEKAPPQAKPVEIWKKACLSGSYPLSKLWISSLSMWFASDIAKLGFHVLEHLDKDSESECEDDSEESHSISEPEKEESGGENESISEDENDGKAVNASSDLCPNQFPLLHKLSVHSNFMDKLLQELVKYNGWNSIEYVQWNNWPGYLVPHPLFRSIEKYESAITAKTTSFMDNIVSNISKSATCTKSEAAECLLRGLYQ